MATQSTQKLMVWEVRSLGNNPFSSDSSVQCNARSLRMRLCMALFVHLHPEGDVGLRLPFGTRNMEGHFRRKETLSCFNAASIVLQLTRYNVRQMRRERYLSFFSERSGSRLILRWRYHIALFRCKRKRKKQAALRYFSVNISSMVV